MYFNSFLSMIIPGFNWQQWVVMRFKRSPALGRPTMSGVDSGFITAELVNLWIFLLISRIVRLCEYPRLAVRWSCSRTCEPLNSCSASNVSKEWPSVFTVHSCHSVHSGNTLEYLGIPLGWTQGSLEQNLLTCELTLGTTVFMSDSEGMPNRG